MTVQKILRVAVILVAGVGFLTAGRLIAKGAGRREGTSIGALNRRADSLVAETDPDVPAFLAPVSAGAGTEAWKRWLDKEGTPRYCDIGQIAENDEAAAAEIHRLLASLAHRWQRRPWEAKRSEGDREVDGERFFLAWRAYLTSPFVLSRPVLARGLLAALEHLKDSDDAQARYHTAQLDGTYKSAKAEYDRAKGR